MSSDKTNYKWVLFRHVDGVYALTGYNLVNGQWDQDGGKVRSTDLGGLLNGVIQQEGGTTDKLGYAMRIAERIKARMHNDFGDHTANGKMIRSSLAVDLGLHVILEEVADSLEIDRKVFKEMCGFNQPAAYFI